LPKTTKKEYILPTEETLEEIKNIWIKYLDSIVEIGEGSKLVGANIQVDGQTHFDSISFDTEIEEEPTEIGSMFWDSQDKTVAIVLEPSNGGVVKLQLGQEMYIRATNKTGTTISNPNGTATFTPYGGNWSATPVNYDYIFSGDSNPFVGDYYSQNYTQVPFLVTGYTNSTLLDLAQYGPKYNLLDGKYKVGVQVTGSTGSIGTVWGYDPTNTYIAYTIDDIDYYDYEDYTLFVVNSSGLTQNDLILSAITKNEGLINVIDQPEVQTDVFIERGKQAVLEYIERIGEIDNVGDLEKYGYGFFKVKKDTD